MILMSRKRALHDERGKPQDTQVMTEFLFSWRPRCMKKSSER